ncbi:hypothetical protein EDC94DRAFT_580166 [Helicostylum pulchrum]|nr:hypothetical protein EDC94DRAFT_580166 [Helicostylum pulchrum]
MQCFTYLGQLCSLVYLHGIEKVDVNPAVFSLKPKTVYVLGCCRSLWLVRLHQAFQDHQNLYLVLDYHAGADLSTLLQRCHSIPEKISRIYAAEIMMGLQELHRHSILYRDLKPENVLIAADGHLVLADFGISKMFDDSDTYYHQTVYLSPAVQWTLLCLYQNMGNRIVVGYEQVFRKTLSDGIYDGTKRSRVPGCLSHPSRGWASGCLLLCQVGLSSCITDISLDPFVAFGLFLTQQARSIITAPCNNDSTMKLLYNLTNQHCETITGNQLHLVEAISQICDCRDSEYERLIELINNDAPASVLLETIENARSRNCAFKRKYLEIDETDTSISEAINSRNRSTKNPILPSSLSYEKGHAVCRAVQNKARKAKGLTNNPKFNRWL